MNVGLRVGIGLVVILAVYLSLLSNLHRGIWDASFSEHLIQRYLRSQDIPHEVPRRTFLSDSEIHITAGVLYASGKHPLEYNFQHPPLGKYLYGISVMLTKNPYLVQIGAGMVLILLTFLLGKELFSSSAGLIGSALLMIDPLFLKMSGEALLDLLQAVFIVTYVLLLLKVPRNYWVQGLLLGCIGMTKFWSTAVFVGLVGISWLWQDEIRSLSFSVSRAKVSALLKILFGSMTVVTVCYIDSLKSGVSLIELGIWQGKILVYWLHHSVASMPGNAWLMWLGGWYKNWWEPFEWKQASVWSLAWPVSWVCMVVGAWKWRRDTRLLLGLGFAVLYLGMLGLQAPFERYFVVLLPFVYVGAVGVLLKN